VVKGAAANTDTQTLSVIIKLNSVHEIFTLYTTHHDDNMVHVFELQRMSSRDVIVGEGERMHLHGIDLLYPICSPQQMAMMHVCRHDGGGY